MLLKSLLLLVCVTFAFGDDYMLAVMNSLESTYSSAAGDYWRWSNAPELFGRKWNFAKDKSGLYLDNACNDWQGICCLSQLLSNETNNCKLIATELNAVVNTNDTKNMTPNNVVAIYLADFNMSGSISAQLFDISTLLYFYISYNPSLVGSIPPSLSTASQLIYISFSNNNMGGTIPNLAMPGLLGLYLDHNLLEGSLPSLLSLPAVESLSLNDNFLQGTIPSLSNLLKLELLYLDNNYLEGTIPVVATLVQLHGIFADRNMLEGTIPELSNLVSLVDVYMNGNMLIGTIPSLNGLTNVTSLFMNNNQLTGTIPALLDLYSLSYLYLNNNFLTGIVPTQLSQLQQLSLMDLQVNFLSGTISTEMSTLKILNSLLIQENLFTGSLENCFPHSLETLDVSDNNFSGQIPSKLFSFPNITHVSMVKNCFSGSLPEDVCLATDTLMSLALDGLTSGSNCQASILDGLTNTFVDQRFVQGSIPSCYFQMSKLHTLQLSGNGLSGQLANCEISLSLRNLSLSHNRLSGVIPDSIQNHEYDLLDLSYNKLYGVIGSLQNFYVESSLFNRTVNRTTTKQLILQVNRLSGNIPLQYRLADNIQVVSGNLFDCESESDLPVNDPGTLQAQCGSIELNIGLSIWLCVTIFYGFIFFTIIACGGYFNAAMQWNICAPIAGMVLQCMSQSYDYFEASSPRRLLSNYKDMEIFRIVNFAQFIRDIGLLLCMFALVSEALYLPFEIIVKYVNSQQFSTHEYQYAYTPSLAFVSSDVPAAIVMAATLLLMTVIWLILFTSDIRGDGAAAVHDYQTSESSSTEPIVGAEQLPTDSSRPNRKYFEILSWIGFILIDVAVMFTINSCYLIVALYYSKVDALIAVVALVVFKITWNARILPFFVKQIEAKFGDTSQVSTGMMMAWLILFNNVLAPVIITVSTQPECFYNIFVPADQIVATVIYTSPDDVSFKNGKSFIGYTPHVEQLYFEPPFTYSYQCSSSLITYYMPMYVIMYLYFGLVSPVVSCAVTWAHINKNSQNNITMEVLNWIGFAIMQDKDSLLSEEICILGKSSSNFKQLLNARDVAAVLMCHLATLLTFGLAYPLLAILICFAGCAEILQWRILIGRYMIFVFNLPDATVDNSSRKLFLLHRLDRSCAGVGDMLRQSRWMLITGMSLFFAIFLLDMAGDKAQDNWERMLWAPISVLAWPVALVVLESLVRCLSARSKREKDAAGTNEITRSRKERGISFKDVLSFKKYNTKSSAINESLLDDSFGCSERTST